MLYRTRFPARCSQQREQAAKRLPNGHADWTARRFVTLDPAPSTDLDQAFAIARDGADLILDYAIADVAHFVADGDPVDAAAWKRGETVYLPDGKERLSANPQRGRREPVAQVDRPAVVFSVRVAPSGTVRLDAATRAIIRSQAKLAYETVTEAGVPDGFAELPARIEQAEDARGAERVDSPEQELMADTSGNYALTIRPQLESEQRNASLSLATNLAIADALLAHQTGLFRVMPKPDERAIRRLHHSAKALGLTWPKEMTLAQFERTLDPANPLHAAFHLAVRRAGPKASYAAFAPGVLPWHSAMAATYVHATAPLRRLADRFVIEATLQVANGQALEFLSRRRLPAPSRRHGPSRRTRGASRPGDDRGIGEKDAGAALAKIGDLGGEAAPSRPSSSSTRRVGIARPICAARSRLAP